jgi:hypothetical protein
MLKSNESAASPQKPQEQPAPSTPSAPVRAQTPPPLTPEDFYYEGSNLVFTAAYHRKRGYCCNSGCRHCPFA